MKPIEQTQKFPDDRDGIARAAQLLSDGALVSFPTETVYGLGADARNGKAVAEIFAAKGRPHFNPLIAHVPNLDAAAQLATLNEQARALAKAFWPGPLTMVLPRRADSGLSDLITAGLDTVAIRVPAHPVAQSLLQAFGGPVAAPSANISGQISPTRAEHVLEGLAGRIAAVVDGGACGVGVESTIIGLAGSPRLLRPGGLAAEDIEAVLGQPLERSAPNAAIAAPGMLASHYAPNARVVLNALRRPKNALWLGFGPTSEGADLNLSSNADLTEAAANLFHHLRVLDKKAAADQVIAIAPVPSHGLGAAINDRLQRAAAPRD